MRPLSSSAIKGAGLGVAETLAPPIQTKQNVARIQRIVPWKNFTNIPSLLAYGTQSYLGSISLVGYDQSEGYIFSNNTDSIIYIGVQGNINDVKNSSLATIGPFQSQFISTDLNNLTILAQCYGLDFTTTRLNISPGDTRFSPQASLDIYTAASTTPLPIQRRTWTRIYDTFDLTYNDPFTVLTTGLLWTSPYLTLTGSSAISVYGLMTVSAATTTAIVLAVTDNFPTDQQGSFSVGNTNYQVTPLAGGAYYPYITITGTETPRPYLQWQFLPGGSAATVTLTDLLLTMSMSN